MEKKMGATPYSALSQKSQKSYFIESYVNCMYNKRNQSQTSTCQNFQFHIHHFTQANKPITSFSRLHLHTAFAYKLASADPRTMKLLALVTVLNAQALAGMPLRHK